jgi:hypothetical protein
VIVIDGIFFVIVAGPVDEQGGRGVSRGRRAERRRQRERQRQSERRDRPEAVVGWDRYVARHPLSSRRRRQVSGAGSLPARAAAQSVVSDRRLRDPAASG